jgi:DNA-binding HxlR family transcriptional regulator
LRDPVARRLDGITHKALADTLKRLERNGLVTRTVLPTAPIGVEYAITPLGHSLRQPFEALCAWAMAHGDAIAAAGAAHDSAKAA